jgi:hypothetical protein
MFLRVKTSIARLAKCDGRVSSAGERIAVRLLGVGKLFLGGSKMGTRKTDFLGIAALAVMLAGAAAGAVKTGRVVERERAGPAVIAVIFLSDANNPGYVDPAAVQGRDALATVDAGQQRLEEKIANTDLSTLIRVYCRLAEETLRSQDRQDRRQTGVRYVYLSSGVDWPKVSGDDEGQNPLQELPGTLRQENDRDAAGRRVMPRPAEDLAALDKDAFCLSPDAIFSDPMAVETAQRLWERVRAEQDADIVVSYQGTDVPQRQWSQTVAPEPSTVALMAAGCALVFRRGKKRG